MKRKISLLLVLLVFGFAQQEVYSQNKIDQKGRKQGYWSKSDKNGNKIYEGNFKDDCEDGLFTHYYEDGKTIKSKTEYKNKGSFATVKFFNKEGGLISEGFYANKKKDSLWTLYDSKGNKIAEERYTKGLKNGESNYWDRDKVLIETITYKNDIKNGLFFKNTYSRGYFYCNFKDGKRDGVYEDFYYFNKIKIKGLYRDDKMEGSWKYFDSIGNCVKTQLWEKDVLKSEKVRLDFGRGDTMVETKDIAFFYQTGKRLKIVLFNANEISCINNVDELFDLLGLDNFIQLNGKMQFFANLKALKGIGDKVGEDYIILLEPKTQLKVITDKESRKAMELFFQKQEF
ncbi:MAG: hypothetical protein VB048_00145 [Bacteroidaceae bacterium]|nr:hypothetical protein [Bacteroidaceae bacterium]MEA5099208.1 hypothetical protein [Bacteroidales bacterium]